MRVYNQHGPRHGTGGSDRRGGGYPAYNYDNVSDWLYIETTDSVDGSLSALDPLGVVFDGLGVGITNSAGGGGLAQLFVQGGDTLNDFYVQFGGSPDAFIVDGHTHMSSSMTDYFQFGQADGSGNNSVLSLNVGDVELGGTGGIDIVSNAANNISPFPVDFTVNSVQIAAGDATNYGTVVLEAFDNQGTPAYTEFFAGYVDFNPNPYTYNGQTAQILGGQKFTVVGSDGSPIFQVLALEQGGTVHIKTGTTVHADL